MIDELLREYAEMFDDSFPIYGCPHQSEEELIKIIENCINTNTPYEPEYDDDLDY